MTVRNKACSLHPEEVPWKSWNTALMHCARERDRRVKLFLLTAVTGITAPRANFILNAAALCPREHSPLSPGCSVLVSAVRLAIVPHSLLITAIRLSLLVIFERENLLTMRTDSPESEKWRADVRKDKMHVLSHEKNLTESGGST